MTPAPTASLRVGDLIARTFGICVRNLVPFLVLTAIVQAPSTVAALLLEAPTTERERTVLLQAQLALVVMEALLTYVLTGALTYGVVQQLRGTPASLRQSVRHGLSAMLRTLGTGILCAIHITARMFLLVIPGIVETMRLFVALPVTVMENRAFDLAMKRSDELTAGSRWPLFGAFLVPILLNWGLLFLATHTALLVGADERVLLWTDVILRQPMHMFGAAMSATAYAMLRQGKENVDAAALAAVFD